MDLELPATGNLDRDDLTIFTDKNYALVVEVITCYCIGP